MAQGLRLIRKREEEICSVPTKTTAQTVLFSHDFHQFVRHVVGPLFRAVILLIILVEADEYGVNPDAVYTDKDASDEVAAKSDGQQRNPAMLDFRQDQIQVKSNRITLQEVERTQRHPNSNQHPGQKEDKVTDSVDGGDQQNIAHYQTEAFTRGRTKTVTVYSAHNVSVAVDNT